MTARHLCPHHIGIAHREVQTTEASAVHRAAVELLNVPSGGLVHHQFLAGNGSLGTVHISPHIALVTTTSIILRLYQLAPS